MNAYTRLCYYCGKECSQLAGDPGVWAIPLCHADDPANVKWHHIKCVSERLAERDALKLKVERLCVAVEKYFYEYANQPNARNGVSGLKPLEMISAPQSTRPGNESQIVSRTDRLLQI